MGGCVVVVMVPAAAAAVVMQYIQYTDKRRLETAVAMAA